MDKTERKKRYLDWYHYFLAITEKADRVCARECVVQKRWTVATLGGTKKLEIIL